MINMETIRFMEMLNELAEKTTHGFMDWNSTDDADVINNFNGILFDSKNDDKVILAKCVIDAECLAYYGQNAIYAHERIIVRAFLPEAEDEPDAYVSVSVIDPYNNKEIIEFVIKDGRWETEEAD